VTRVSDKAFVGKDIIYAAVWKKNDERMVYNMVYYDSKSGRSYAKRFAVTSITRDRPYDLTRGGKGSKVLYFTANPNSESEVITVYLTPVCRARKKVFDFDFGELAIKGRGSQGNVLTKWPVRKITRKALGASSLGSRELWFDETIGRLNTEGRGLLLGAFDNGDLILALYKDGTYQLTDYDMNNHYDIGKLISIEAFDPETVISAVHYDGKSKNFYVKRFKIETQTTGKPFSFISDAKGSSLIVASTSKRPLAEMEYLKGRGKQKFSETVDLTELVDIKGWKARGNRLSPYRVTYVGLRAKEDDKNQTPDAAEAESKAHGEKTEENKTASAEKKSEDEMQLGLFNDKKS